MAKTHIRIALVFVGLLVFFSNAEATDRFYRDRTVLSANRKLRLEAKSPDNAKGMLQPFAKNFVYTLFDADTNLVHWQRKQMEREGSPISVFVHDQAWVAVWTGYDQLLLLNPRGEAVLNLSILHEGLPADEVKKYVQRTTAGPLWAGHSLWYFFVAEREHYFGIRTWWDRRIIVSLTPAKVVPDEGSVKQAAEQAEKTIVLSTLEKAAKVARKWAAKKLPEYSDSDISPWREVDHVGSALHVAGRMRIKEAVPLLRELEPIPDFGCSGGGWTEENAAAGEMLITSEGNWDPIRQCVHLALRRLGAKPAGFPARQMVLQSNKEFPGTPYVPRACDTLRAERVAVVSTKMGAQQIVDAIGAPDYILFPGRNIRNAGKIWWEYDIDADPPYTLRIDWNEETRRPHAIDKIVPPVWKDGNERDRS